MTKYFLLFLIAAQSLCFSENIKFYIFDSRHGNELKPDSVILENITTKKRIYLLTDTLILTEVGSSPQAFINTSPDFKAKANIINNNIDLEIDNSGAENIAIELYGYLGNTVFSEEAPINIGVTRKNISLENIHDKLLFLRVKSAKSIQTIKLNRTASDFTYEATPILKPGDEILKGDIIDTAYKYNLYIYKKGYRNYSDNNISFTGKKYYVANLVEMMQNERIHNAHLAINGIRIINNAVSLSSMPRTPSHRYEYLDTVVLNFERNIEDEIIGQYSRCSECPKKTKDRYTKVCYSNISYDKNGGASGSYYLNISTFLNFQKQTMDSLQFDFCSDFFVWLGGGAETENKISLRIFDSKSVTQIKNQHYIRFEKNELEKMFKNNKLFISMYYLDYANTNGGYSVRRLEKSSKCIYEIMDDAYIEIAFWE